MPSAFLIAVIMSLEREVRTVVSLSPWNAQMGRWVSFPAFAVSPPPQMGMAAAKSDGWRWMRSQVAKPPMEMPVM